MDRNKNKDWRLLDDHVRFLRPVEGFQGGKDLLENLFGRSGNEILDDIRIKRLKSRWNELAGPLARHSQPVRIRGKFLEIHVEKPVYSQEFQFFREDILKQIASMGDMNIADLRVKIGPVHWAPVDDSHSPPLKRRETEKEIDPGLLEGLHKLQSGE